jgi:hypothetical protein
MVSRWGLQESYLKEKWRRIAVDVMTMDSFLYLHVSAFFEKEGYQQLNGLHLNILCI